MFNRSFLVNLRQRAMRQRVWFKAIDHIERGIVNLVARLVDGVESSLLGCVLVKISAKLRDAMKSEFLRHLEDYGYGAARRVVDQALSFGSVLAGGWVRDKSFISYLTLMDLNKPSGWGIH